jgi:hypothetical protein
VGHYLPEVRFYDVNSSSTWHMSAMQVGVAEVPTIRGRALGRTERADSAIWVRDMSGVDTFRPFWRMAFLVALGGKAEMAG